MCRQRYRRLINRHAIEIIRRQAAHLRPLRERVIGAQSSARIPIATTICVHDSPKVEVHDGMCTAHPQGIAEACAVTQEPVFVSHRMHQRKKSATHPDHGQRRLSKNTNARYHLLPQQSIGPVPDRGNIAGPPGGYFSPLNPAARAGFRGGDFMNQLCSSGVVLFLREKEYQKDLLPRSQAERGLCNAGNGHRDFDSLVKSQGKASKSRNLFVPPCYVHRDRAMLVSLMLDPLDAPLPLSRGRGQGMEFGPTPFASISRTMFDRPATATKVKHRDRAMLRFVIVDQTWVREIDANGVGPNSIP